MNTIDTVRYEMLVRVRQFGDDHRDRFPDNTPGGEAFATIAAAVTQLSGHAVSKLAAATGAKNAKAAAGAALVSKIDEIARAARGIAEATPGFDDAFQRPLGRQTDQRLLTAGQLFVRDTESQQERFVAFGLRDTFHADLIQAVEGFRQALLRVESARDRRAAANAGIEQAIEAGSSAARRLDVIVGIAFGNDRETMAVWERNRRLESPPRRRRAARVPSPDVPLPVAKPEEQPASSASAPAAAPVAGAPVAVTPVSAAATVPTSLPAVASAPAVGADQPNEADLVNVA